MSKEKELNIQNQRRPHVRLSVTLWTISSSVMGFSQQEYWSGLPFPPPGALPEPGIEPVSPVS